MCRYRVGQIINIGYYGGFRKNTLIKTQAEVIRVSGTWVDIIVKLRNGGHRKMYGYDYELEELELNFYK